MEQCKDNMSIVEETAKELMNAFEKGFQSCMNLDDSIKAVSDVIDELYITAIMEKVDTYTRKCADATIFTKWYWLRKWRKANEELKNALDSCKIIIHDNINSVT